MAAPPPLPREHGAWAMLLLPLVLGSLAARAVTPASSLVLPATVLLFLARFAPMGGTRPRRGDARRLAWAAAYLASSAACLLAAVLLAAPDRRGGAIAVAAATGALGAANAGLVVAGRGRTLVAELLAMVAAALTAPLVLVLSGAPLDGPAIGVGALCLAYFLAAVSFVRTYRAPRDPGGRRAAVAGCLAVHAALAAGLAGAWRAGWLPAALLASFVPVLVRTGWGLARPPANLGMLGRRELGVAVTFLVLAAAGILAGTGAGSP